jgi:diguanylate cyclase (GGDEF)-like protein
MTLTLEEFFRWEQGLLAAASLADFLGIAGRPPAPFGASGTASFVLADPGHELRHLAAGVDASAGADLIFVDGLQGVAPQFAALHGAWRGAYRAADHGMLFGGTENPDELLMVPLGKGDELLGAYNLGLGGGLPEFGHTERIALAHLSVVLTAGFARLFDRARLLQSGISDPLTGWHSRRYLQSRLREEIARCQRYGTSVACLVVDVDRLQAINQDHGQTAGDLVLAELAARIETQLRASDAAAHYGGDAFAVLLPATTAALAIPLARRILAAVRSAEVKIGDGVSKPMTVSVGLAEVCPDPQADGKAVADELLSKAEAAMHRAKRQGGDSYVVSPA